MDIFGTQETPSAPRQVQLDPTTQALMNQQRQQALGSAQSFQAPLNQGIEQRVAQLGGMQYGPSGGFAATGTTPGMNEAIRNVYAGETQDTLKRIKTQNEFTAEQNRTQALRQAAANAFQQLHVKNNYQQMLRDAQNAMDAQRAEFVGALSGLASYGAGMAYASRKQFAKAAEVDPMNYASPQEFLPRRTPTLAPLGSYEGM